MVLKLCAGGNVFGFQLSVFGQAHDQFRRSRVMRCQTDNMFGQERPNQFNPRGCLVEAGAEFALLVVGLECSWASALRSIGGRFRR